MTLSAPAWTARRCIRALSKHRAALLPSIEDKIVRFADRDSHQIFVEPEGLNTHEIYPNGISTSLPFDVQYEFVRSMLGFENAEIVRPRLCDRIRFF